MSNNLVNRLDRVRVSVVSGFGSFGFRLSRVSVISIFILKNLLECILKFGLYRVSVVTGSGLNGFQLNRVRFIRIWVSFGYRLFGFRVQNGSS